MTEADRSGIAFPIAHIGGPINLVAALVSGATLILIEQFDPVPTCAVLAGEGVTMAGSGTAFHLAYLDVQARRPHERLFAFLRCCPGGGAPSRRDCTHGSSVSWGVRASVGMGLTEAPVLTMGRPTDPDAALDESEGGALPGVTLRAAWVPPGRSAGPGEAGELRAHAPQVMLGYVEGSLDAAAFDVEGWLRTGDLGSHRRRRLRAHHRPVEGRRDPQRREHRDGRGGGPVPRPPHVADAAVIGLPDPRTGERLCAVVELTPGAPTLDVASVAAYLGDHGLRRQAWPEQVETVGALPRTVAGKVDKRQLQDRFGRSESVRADDEWVLVNYIGNCIRQLHRDDNCAGTTSVRHRRES